MRQLVLIISVFTFTACISACGNRGDLYLPDEPVHNQRTPEKSPEKPVTPTQTKDE